MTVHGQGSTIRKILSLTVLGLSTLAVPSLSLGQDCSKIQPALPNGTSVANVIPSAAAEGTVLPVTVTGKGLAGFTLVVCPKPDAPSFTPSGGSVLVQDDPQQSSTATTLHGLLTVMPGTTSTFTLNLKNSSGLVFSTNKQLGISSSSDYINCAFSLAPILPRNSNVDCSYVPLSYGTARHIFGKGVADRFIVFQITVRNKNHDFEFLLQDVRLGTPVLIVSSVDKGLIRGLAEKTEQFSARAIAFRMVEAGATVLTGIAGVVSNELLKDAANLVAGPTQTGFRGAIPDLAQQEIGRIDDFGFSVKSTVIPKNAALPVVAFLSSETFAQDFRNLKGGELLAFQAQLRVQVAGTHIQQVDLNKPTLTRIISEDLKIANGALDADAHVILQGTALNTIQSVSFQIRQTGSQPAAQALTFPLTPMAGDKALDPNVDVVVIPKATKLSAGSYMLSLITKDGNTIQTSVEMTVPAPTAAPAPAPAPAPPAAAAPGPPAAPAPKPAP